MIELTLPQGILLVDKDSGWTSFDVVAKIRSLTRVKKIGHAGTLDPLASGLLIVLVGKRFTLLQDQFLKQDKTYYGTAILGLESDTDDILGNLTTSGSWSKLSQITQDQLISALQLFVGETDQIPPNYSAIKIKGKKMYDLARKGQDLPPIPSRKVKIYSLKLDSFEVDTPKQQINFGFWVSCSSGTYIRSLVRDLGRKLEVGATLSSLRRTQIGKFDVAAAIKIDELENKLTNQENIFLPDYS